MTKKIKESNFNKFIEKEYVLVDFYADWCGPCRMMSPIIDELSKEMKTIKFGKVDVDKETKLSKRFNIMSIPAFKLFKDGKEIEQFNGSMSKDIFKEKLLIRVNNNNIYKV